MHDNVIIEAKLNAPLEKVWAAITEKSQMKEWYFDIPDFELSLHQEFNFYGAGEGGKYQHHGEILEIIPQKKLKYSWSYPEISKEKTLVIWQLEEDQEATLVTLTHKGLENLEHLGQDFHLENFRKGWSEIIGSSLKNYVEP